MMEPPTQTTFPLGRIVATRNALSTVVPSDVVTCLAKHASGDWGELTEDDKLMNELALVDGNRLVSAYRDAKGTKFWIITEADRSATTVLLPEDY